jgi:hypothetical protein
MTINYANYPADWQPLANDAADSSFRGNPMSAFYEGGRVGTKPVRIRIPREDGGYAKGGLASAAKDVRDAGVGGDDLIIHINRQEYDELKKHWGDPTINPHTGMPQFTPFYKQKWFAPVAAIGAAALMATGVGAPIGAALMPAAWAGETFAGAALPSILGNTLIGAGIGGLTGGSKGAATGALLGGGGTLAMGALGSTSAGVKGTGEGGFSAWGDRMVAGDYFGSGAGGGGGGGGGGENPNATHLTNVGTATGYSGNTLAGADAARAANAELAMNTSKAVGDVSLSGAGFGANNAADSSLLSSKYVLPAALLGASALGGSKSQALPSGSGSAPASNDPNLSKRLDLAPLSRPRVANPANYYTYGSTGENTYYGSPVEAEKPTVAAATGGALSHFVQGGGTGRSDSIDAKLSDGEYVIDAETVALLGDGSSKAGAKRLDQFRANIRKQKGSQLAKGKFSTNAKSPEEYI